MNNDTANANGANVNEQPMLMPMEGVTIAPIDGKPVNASSTATATSASFATTATSPTTQAVTPVPATTPVATQTVPGVTTTQPTATPSQVTPGIVVPDTTEPVVQPQPDGNTTVPPKKKRSIAPLLLIIILGLGFALYYFITSFQAQINQLKYNCTPVVASKEEHKLDLDSTLVQDLYKKVATNIREDIAQPEFNDNLRLYLAYRQVLETDKYDSNCNLFSTTSMEPYSCEVSNFVPKAFKEEVLVQEIKKMYGENTQLALNNIQLGSSCLVGYQYIPQRGEFVQGYCNQQIATSYKVTKKLVEAISTDNTITLKEDVKYYENEKLALPDSLKSGYYYYTFRLDLNYNYVLVNRTYESKY